jgi:hypothetical protein
VSKKRWIGGEGGWENPFPSGNSQEEFYNIQLEFAMVQKCDLAILGDSGFGERIYAHMCCNSPLTARGMKPQRCICPPRVRLQQSDFSCEKGNKLMCSEDNVGGDITRPLDDPSNMLGARFSFTKDAIQNATRVHLKNADNEINFMLGEEVGSKDIRDKIAASALAAKTGVCREIDHGLARKRMICNKR